MKGFGRFLMYFSNLGASYKRISNDPEKKDKSVYFGIRSILSSIFGAIIVVLCAFGISALMDTDNIVSIVIIVVLVLCMLSALFECTLRGLITMIYQLRLNKQPIGWASLAVFIVTFIAMLVLSILMIAKVI